MSIKLSFKNINTNETHNISSIDNILLSKNNPRFTVITNLNINLADFIIQDLSNDIESQKEIYHELLKNEGDLSDLVRLAKNIWEFGFINKNEEILLVYDPKLKKYVVAEGNRRIMLLKIIIGDFKFPEENFFSPNLFDNNNTEYTNDQNNDEDIDNKNIVEKTINNYKEFKNILNLIRNKDENWSIYYKIIDNKNSDELWSLIFDKHITGKRPGMREWSRSKYFADILTFFPNGIQKDDDLKQFKKINREKDVVIKDFKEAQYVYACFYSNFNRSANDIKYNDEDIINKLKSSARISALERTHSFNKIRNLYSDKFLNSNRNLFDVEYFNIEYDPNNHRIIFNEGKLSKIDFLSHIYTWWDEKKITTRSFRKNVIETILDDMNTMINNINTKNLLTKEQLWDINEFQISEKQLENIIVSNEDEYEKQKYVLDRFKNAKKIRTLIFELSVELKNMNSDDNWKKYNNTLIGALKIFVNQMQFNAPEKYYNAVFISIRSFFELLIIFVSYYIFDKNSSQKEEIIECIVCGNEISKKRIELYNTLYKEDNKMEYASNRKKFLNILFGINPNIKDYKEKINTYLWDANKWTYINRPIHAFHKLYIIDKYSDIMKEYGEYEELLLFILKNGNWKQFEELNNKINEKINSVNENTSK